MNRLYSAGWIVFVAACLLGVATGIGSYTFVYARGFSYASDESIVCANCHIMQNHYDSWRKSSHHAVAVCNDCHTPPSFVGKYLTKARNGYHHSIAFTTGDFHEPILITEKNRQVAERACRKCHADIVEAIDTSDGSPMGLSCTRCHSEVGHME